jgi:hypothetical protein
VVTTGGVTTWGCRALLAVAVTVLLGVLAPAGVAMAAPVAEPEPDPASSAEVAVESPVDDAEEDEDQAIDVPEAPAAGPDQRARATWESHGRPNRLIIVRADTVDTVEAGGLLVQAPRVPGPATLAELAAVAPAGWVVLGPSTPRISAMVVLGPKVVLDLHGAGPTVQLVGGPTAAEAASIHTGSGQLSAQRITVTSVDPATGLPMPLGPGRPFVSVGVGGRLLATDATFSDLGTPITEPDGRPGVGFGAGSNGSLVRTSLLRNSAGLRLNGSSGVRLESVLITGSAADGLVLRGDRGTRMSDVRVEHNGGNGVLVTGPSTDRPVTGIATSGNAAFGVALVGQTGSRVAGVTSYADGAGGLQLSAGADVTVAGFDAVDQPIGVLTHVGAARVTLDDVHVIGGERGVVVDKTTAGLALTGSRIERTAIGVAIAGRGVRLQGVQIGDSRSGVRIERGASDVSTVGLTVSGGQDGVVVAPGTSGVALRDLVTDGVTGYGVRTAGPNTEIVGGRIGGGETGIAADAATTVRDTEISRVDVGIRARSAQPVAVQAVVVIAETSGIAVDTGSRVVLTDSQVRAAEAVHGAVDLVGHNELSLPPLNALSMIGIPLVVLALLLDQLQRFRARRRRR